MQYTKTENNYIIRLEKGEEIIYNLTSFAEKEKITTAFFNGIGAVLSAELAFYSLSEKEYQHHPLDEPHEIASLTGNISIVENEPFIHAHCVLSDKNLECRGGHIVNAVVNGTCEVYLSNTDLSIERTYDEITGLKLLNCNS